MSNANHESFSTGAIRDTQTAKPMPGLLSPFAAERKAWVMAKGAGQYGARNWEKGMPFSRVIESLERHLMSYKQGKIDADDHLAQLAWNADALLHYEELIKRGILPVELDDMPHYLHLAVKNQPNTCAMEGCMGDASIGDQPTEADYDEIDAEFDAEDVIDSRDAYANYVDQFDGPVLGHFGGNFELHRPWPLTPFEEGWLDAERMLYERAVLEARTQKGLDGIQSFGDRMFDQLVALGCPESVAEHIVGGTTFAVGENMVSTKFVYVAGPMRGHENFNFPAFDAARDSLLKLGYNVISPADIDRYVNPDADQVEKVDVKDQTRFVLRDFWSLFFIRKSSDEGAICMLFDWVKSTGAAGEFFLARWLGLKTLRFTKGPPSPHTLWVCDARNLVSDFCLENQR